MSHRNDLDPLPDEDLALLAAYRGELGPDPAQLERVRQGLHVGSVRVRAARAPLRRSLGTIVVAALSAAAVILIARTWKVSSMAEADREDLELAVHGASTPEAARPVVPAVRERPGPVAIDPPAQAPSAEPAPIAADRPSLARLRAPAAGPEVAAPTRAPAIGDEIDVLSRARAALAAGELEQARAALRQHELRHPQGAMAEERDALLAIVECKQGAERGRAAGFAARHPRSPLLDRVGRACDGKPEQRTIEGSDRGPNVAPEENRP